MKVTVGSRGSPLALWQANWVKERLGAAGHEVEVRIIKTTGDKFPEASLTGSSTKGLFIKEIEEALAAGEIDLAVHSLKDLPTDQPGGLVVGAVPRRDDARDVLISRSGRRLADLPSGSTVGTSSLRRQAQLRHLRRDLDVRPVRGNLDTRLRKLDRADYDALVLAAAGLQRLALDGRVTEFFDPAAMCPAVGQGALALEVRDHDDNLCRAIAPLDDPATHQAVRAERAALRHLGGGCQAPIAAHATWERSELRLTGVVATPDGARLIRSSVRASSGDPEALGAALAEDLLMQGARQLLDALRTG